MRRAVLGLGALIALFAIVTALALEGGRVAVLETQRTDSGTRRTHVWYAEADGGLWLEAATPERAWLRDVQGQPGVRLLREGVAQRFRAMPEPGAAARAALRARLRAQYGWRDRFVALLQDTSRSVAVRLVPVSDPVAAP